MAKYGVFLHPLDLEERLVGWVDSETSKVYIHKPDRPPEPVPNFEVQPGKTVMEIALDIISTQLNWGTGNTRLALVPLEIDQHYRRIYRPIMHGQGRYYDLDALEMIEVLPFRWDERFRKTHPIIPIDNSAYQKSLSQLALLTDRLALVFRTVEPESDNLEVYGHEVRNLLIIACTEVEAQWKAILDANSYPWDKTCSTNDYVKLPSPLKLAEYEVELPLYPEIQPLRPFSNWALSNPTRSLTWYDAYNATKHDREKNFSRATMSNAINAIAACAILLIAQFGKRDSWKSEISEFFQFKKVPTWKPEEMYMCTSKQKYKPIDYKF